MRLYDRLRQEFGRDRVFRYPVAAGANLGPETAPVTRASGFILLVVIGPTWITSQGPSGQPSLDDPRDPVRAEVEAALHNDLPLFPVLVTGARLPGTDELPVRLRALIRQPAARLTPEQFDDDVSALIDRLSHAGGPATSTAPEWRFPADPAATALITPQHLADRPEDSGDTEIRPLAAAPPEETAELDPGPPTEARTPAPAGGIPGPGEAAAAPPPAWRPEPMPVPPAVPPEPQAHGEAGQDQPSGEVKTSKVPQLRRSVQSWLTTKLARTTLTALFSVASITIAAVAIVIHSSNHPPAHPNNRPSAHSTGSPHHHSHRRIRAKGGCPPSPPPPNLTPAAAVRTMYRDINHHSFCAAWNLGASSITPGRTYKNWVAGFSDLVQDHLTVISVAGSNPATVNVSLEYFNKNAPPETVTGYYYVENGRIAGGHLS